MKRVLGLDLGTTSIGWAVVDQATDESEQSQIVKVGVRLNPLTTDEQGDFEKGKPITTTAERTAKRGMRRNLQRYKLRRNHLLSVLRREGWLSNETILCEDGPSSTFDTYKLRALAATREITLEQLARVLLMINKKRGYKSNRKTKADATEDGQLIDSMSIARQLYDEGLTPGQYMHRTYNSKNRFVPSFYRSDLIDEFNRIWDFQSQFYPDILTSELRDKLSGQGKTATAKALVDTCKVYAAENKGKTYERNLVEFSWRAQSLEKKMDITIVAYVLASLNGQIAASSGYLGAISDHSKELYFRRQTVGQYLWEHITADSHYRVKGQVFYRTDYLHEFNVIWETQSRFHSCLTDDLKREIRDIVIFYQRRLKSKKFLIATCELEGREITVDGRTYTTGPRVCPKSSPVYQEFKIWQQLNDVVISNKQRKATSKSSVGVGSLFDEEVHLSPEQMSVLHQELSICGDMKSTEALKLLGYDPKHYQLNFEKLHGNSTIVALFGAIKQIIEWSGHDVDNYAKMTAEQRLYQATAIFKALGARTDFFKLDLTQLQPEQLQQQPLFKLWHLLYSYEDDSSASGKDSLITHVEELTGLSHEHAAAIAAITFADDYGSLSTKAMTRILPYLIQGHQYSEACEMAGYRHSKRSITREENEARELLAQLALLPKNSLRNPVVEKIINQMIHVVNAAMQAYGLEDEHGVKRFDEIHIELARELRQTQEQRANATKKIAERTRSNEEIVEILKKEFNVPHPGRNDVLRYRLYQQLNATGFKTLYSGQPISPDQLFSPDIEIEHIIPQALFYDDSEANKTLEYHSVNQAKGRSTAFDYVSSLGQEQLAEYLTRIKFLDAPATRRKYEYLLMTEDAVGERFGNRDLTVTQYIARKAAELLQQVTRDVLVVTGSITAVLREDWQLVDVMKELNRPKYDKLGMVEVYTNSSDHRVVKIKDWSKRNDHRHHAMDALTIAFTTRAHVQYINTVHASAAAETSPTYSRLRTTGKNPRFIAPLPLEIFRAEVKKHLIAVVVSMKAKNKVATQATNRPKGARSTQQTLTPRAQLHKETIYGRRQRYVSRVVKVDKSFTAERIATVARRVYREALLRRLAEYGGDPALAFTGKHSLDKLPLYIDKAQTTAVPSRVKVVELETYYTIRKPLGPDFDAKKIEKVVDARIRRILQERYAELGKTAFTNLEDNPIYLDRAAGITIKSVTINAVNVAMPLHVKYDKHGNIITDEAGEEVPNDFVSTGNNHHVAIYVDAEGNYHEYVVSYFEAMARMRNNLPVVDYDYNAHLGWRFLFTMKSNEFFVLPDSVLNTDVLGCIGNISDLDLLNPVNATIINAHLFRVQKLSTRDYWFRHQYETTVEDKKELRDIAFVHIQTVDKLKGFVKVRVDHLGRIVHVGEY